MSKSALFDKGLKIRKEVVGADYVQRAFDKAGEFGREFQELVTEYCWGASWGREALSRRDRSLLNIVMLGMLGRNAELALHLRGALRNGVTPDEIRDALFQLAIYAGVPAGVESFRIAQEVLESPETHPNAPSKGQKP
ncbi:carboxymuconolactone decarboxylase family protein [Mesorhizobium sp. LNJC405B00]|uniref:carboxymuconolactone decarboxylase family protein n=1 Tax=Mesorhizobium sp. LNJC405B00 TaxID=1287281 RepID=UPI0003CE65F5|nr:carboxymuconolactone decarboxylase family protein [Mesorhizobium sp. LNJC405B00]ESX84585.1 4-carboxymuconolactone decarboxylase [Mesorhizobium sp. LNJC405B00]